MSKTRAEILIELRHRFGQNETTEHLIDWLLDVWETRDFLLRFLGREDTDTAISAVGSSVVDMRPYEHALCELPLEALSRSSLN
ncbi:MAG: hypothetical protein JO031_17090 [Ktedonobacteraceae bacterium]|nr:hypothetical protein [Ktedonobacteraceae bacterium]